MNHKSTPSNQTHSIADHSQQQAVGGVLEDRIRPIAFRLQPYATVCCMQRIAGDRQFCVRRRA